MCALNGDRIVYFVVNINPWIPKPSLQTWQRRVGRDVLVCWVKSICHLGNQLKYSTEGGPHRLCHFIFLNSLQLRKYSRRQGLLDMWPIVFSRENSCCSLCQAEELHVLRQQAALHSSSDHDGIRIIQLADFSVRPLKLKTG